LLLFFKKEVLPSFLAAKLMAGPDRTINVLKLFTLAKPAWSVEEAAAALKVSDSSAYRYFAVLTEAGLLTPAAHGRYVLGPAMIQYDRQIQLTDPLLQTAKPVMARLLQFAPPHTSVLLCRLFRQTVLCIHEVVASPGTTRVSYERGRPMPLFRGATSKIMLPYLSPRELRRVYDGDPAGAAAIGASWDEFRKAITHMRKAGYAVTYAEVDPGNIGIGVAILDESRRPVGSLSYVIPQSEERAVVGLLPLVVSGAREIEQQLQTGT
jgi:DNA-binding IclR family transcriptional regulator